jgi:hypothetical protein
MKGDLDQRDDLDQLVARLMLSGTCCTQVLVQLALDETGRSDPLFVAAVAPLCGGLWDRITCGALTGGVLALGLLHGERPVDHTTVRHYVDWFRQEFGSTDCRDLVEEDALARGVRCPPIVAACYRRARELAGLK